MKVLELKQGSQEWHAARAAHFCASDAPAALGMSKYKSRNKLLHEKKSGLVPDVDAGTQALFDKGHAAEALARPIADRIAGDEFFPTVGTLEFDGLPLLASFDGITMFEDKIFEHKLYNEALADFITSHDDLPETHWPQVEHQLLVSGAERCLFVTSDGTEERLEAIWYESKPDRRATLIAGWRQFAADMEAYEPQAQTAPVAAAPVEGLPAVFVQVTGALTVENNLPKFGEALRAFLDRTPKKPETDEEFATCEAAIKTLTKAEEALDAAESGALAQVACIDDMRTLKATLRDLARSSRLALEKLVKAEKENRKLVIVQKAREALAAFVKNQPQAAYIPQVSADFAVAIKGLKTISSIKNAVDTELARVKIEVAELNNSIGRNVSAIEAHPEHAALFADRASLVLKDAEFVALTIKQRIADHEAAQAEKLEAERAKIRAEEEARAQREAEAKRAEEEAAKPAQAAPVVSTPLPAAQVVTPIIQADTGARITLGQINTRLAPISLNREGLSSLGFEPAGKDRAAILYRESDFSAICEALISHLQGLCAAHKHAA